MVHYNNLSYNDDLKRFLKETLSREKSFYCYVYYLEENEVILYSKKSIRSSIDVDDLCCLVAGAESLYRDNIFLVISLVANLSKDILALINTEDVIFLEKHKNIKILKLTDKKLDAKELFF